MKGSFHTSIIFSALISALCPAFLSAESPQVAVERIIARQNSGKMGVSIVSLRTGKEVFSHQSKMGLKPASVLKLITSSAALLRLGPDFRFETNLYADSLQSGKIRTLYIQGGGDPSLTSEGLWMIARTLKRRGVNEIGKVVADTSLFSDAKERVGQRAYETGTSALAFNHNSVLLEVCPNNNGEPASVNIDPWESGVTAEGRISTVRGTKPEFYVEEQSIKGGDAPSYRVGGSIGERLECVGVYRSSARPTAVFLKTFASFLHSLDIRVGPVIEGGRVPDDSLRLLSYPSKALSEIVADLNHFSTNVIADQIATYLDDSTSGKSLEGGVAKMKAVSNRLASPGDDDTVIVDGSGLSHDNRVTAGLFARLLRLMYQDEDVGPEFVNSLSVGSRNGTLRTRSFGNVLVRGKTGSLDGVSSIAGYVSGVSGERYSFSIIANGVASKARAHSTEAAIISTWAKGS